MDKAKYESLSKLPFEEALGKLEQIVSSMEDGRLPLDSMIEHFEEGSALSDICSSKLENLERKIEILVKSAKEGVPVWKDFDSAGKKESRTASKAAPDSGEDSGISLF